MSATGSARPTSRRPPPASARPASRSSSGWAYGDAHALAGGWARVRRRACHAIRTETINAARLLRREGELGVLREGAYADVIALDGNPLDDITELTRVGAVVAAGRVVRNAW
ncbi:MAG TPA: amidohydrolase family protein [Ilumatobacter sp.]